MSRCGKTYDPLTSFLPVHLVGRSPNILVAYEGAPFNSVPGSSPMPGKIRQGDVQLVRRRHRHASGCRTIQDCSRYRHAACAHHKGSAPALNDLIAGRVDVMFDYPVSVGPHVEAGKLKVPSNDRAGAPTQPAERANHGRARSEGYDHPSWSASWSRQERPRPSSTGWRRRHTCRADLEQVRTHFEKFGTRPTVQQKAEMIPFIEKEIARWGDVIAGEARETVTLFAPRAVFQVAAKMTAVIAPLTTAAMPRSSTPAPTSRPIRSA